ncbi:MAG: glycosyltransferase family 39 protein [Burkholderiales bacterium]|nr:glycosyltransferase family 39 protein [Burkholderiales bacterium]
MTTAALPGAAPRATLREDLRSQPGLLLLALVGCIASFWLGLGSVPLFDLDEGAFTEATREMLASGDWISTTLNGRPRYDKPVLIYWLQAVSVTAFGQNEFAFRLPSALCATAWATTVFLFVRRVRDTRTGLLAALFTATAAGITVIGRGAIADALLNLLLVIACTSAYLYLAERDRRWLRAAYVAIGFGLLAKGPVAVLVPLATTFLYCASKRDLRTWGRAVFDGPGIALMTAIAAPWYVAQTLKEGDAFIQGFFMKHNVDRFSAPMHGFDGSVLFYVPWLFVATLPFTAPLLALLRAPRTLWQDDVSRFCLLWFGFVFVFFSLSGTKLPHYVFYGYTGLFVLMALHAHRLRRAWLALLPAALGFAALLALPWALTHVVAPRVRDPYYAEALATAHDAFGVGFTGSVAAALVAVVALMRVPFGSVPSRLAACGVLQAGVMALFVLPAAGAVQQSPIKQAALLARANGWPVVMWGIDTPSFIVYSGRLVEKRDPRPGDVVLAKMKRLRDRDDYDVLFRKHGVALVRMRAAGAAGAAAVDATATPDAPGAPGAARP